MVETPCPNQKSTSDPLLIHKLCEFTYLSDNIEEHAKPNNTCCIKDKQSYILNTHPCLKKIPITAIPPEDAQLLNKFVEKHLLQRDDHYYYRTDTFGFPRLLIDIKDRDLKNLSHKTHPEVYEYIEKMRLPRELKHWFHTINDIPVAAIPDTTPKKIGFEKLLGSKIYDERKDVMMYGKNKQTLFAAAKRQIKTAPCPSSKIAIDFVNWTTQTIEKEIGDDLQSFSYNYNQWYNHLSAPKQLLIKDIDDYHHHRENFIQLPKRRQEQVLSLHYEAIVKAELQPADGKPRMVCSIPQRIKYAMGPICWQLEEICTNKLRGYCGGKNLTEMALDIMKYLEQGFTKVVEGDGSAFDNSQDVMLKAVDRYIYGRIKDKVYHVPREEFELISNLHYKTMDVKYTLNQKKYTYMTYKVLGTVFSGDSDTTLANTIRMAMYNRYANEMFGLRYGVDYIVFSKGDDFSVLYKESIPDSLIDKIYDTYFLSKPNGEFKILDSRVGKLGQICKFLEKGAANSFKFCSLRSWYTDPLDSTKVTLTRNPAKLYTISQYAIKTKKMSNYRKAQYLIQQAVDYEMNYPGITVFEIMAQSCRDHAALLLQHSGAAEHKIKIYEQHLLAQKKHKNEKQIEFTERSDINKILMELFDIKARTKVENLIYAEYWDNIKAKENQRYDANTPEEIDFVNQQINAEFDTEELKTLVGITNF
jgi:hypothetical protein